MLIVEGKSIVITNLIRVGVFMKPNESHALNKSHYLSKKVMMFKMVGRALTFVLCL